MAISKRYTTIQLVRGIHWTDFRVILIGGLTLLGLVILGEYMSLLQPLRLLLGLAYVLYIPGYCLAAALFPCFDDLDNVERLGLNLGLSIAIIVMLALLLDKLPWGLQQWSILIGEYSVIVLCMAVSLGRRIYDGPEQAYAPDLHWHPQHWWGGLPRLERRIYLLIAGTALLAALCSVWILIVPSSDTYMTEFYMLGAQGNAEDYPRQSTPGQQVRVTAGVNNRERDTANYRIEVWASDRWNPSQRMKIQQAGPISLAPGQEGRLPISWQTPAIGNDQSIELLLFRDGSAEPYRRLQLWIDIGTQP